MKLRFAVMMGWIICAGMACAAEVKVTAVMSTARQGEATTSFAADIPKIFASFKTKGAQNGDKLRGVWIADDVGDAAPAKTKIDEKSLTLEGDTEDGDFSLSMPTNGWPRGEYRLEIYVNDKLATTEKFTVGKGKGPAEKEKAAAADEKAVPEKEEAAPEKEAKAGESSDDEHSFKVHNTTKDKIKKLLASEDGKEYRSFDVGRAGIAGGETITLTWDKSTNNSSCEWFIKAVFADGSETKAEKFDFCDEDLELEF